MALQNSTMPESESLLSQRSVTPLEASTETEAALLTEASDVEVQKNTEEALLQTEMEQTFKQQMVDLVPERNPDFDEAEWRSEALKAEAALRSRDFAGLEKLAAQLCAMRPNFSRGWLLRYISMMQLGCHQEALVEVLKAGLERCEGGLGTAALVQEMAALQDRAPGNISEAPTASDRQVFVGEWDEQGVYVYQAYCDDIADWALAHQRLGGPKFNTSRCTWFKPSFGWVLYRSGYGRKPGQNRVLRIKLPHGALAEILSRCKLVDTNKETRLESASKTKGPKGAVVNGNGVVQWDPERDVMAPEGNGKEPRKMLRRRAIQIGVKGNLSEFYVCSAICIQDVTELSHRVFLAHSAKKKQAMEQLMVEIWQKLPSERPYTPHCSEQILKDLAMLPGNASEALAHLGRGKA